MPKKDHSKEERQFFKDSLELTDKIYLKCTKQNLESDLVIESLVKIRPKVGFIFGAPLVTSKIYSIPEYGCVNIHTGLVQYYRGVDSTQWAIYENKLDRIGATLHYIDNTIDAGNIIGQKRTEISLNDNPEKLFLKTCQAGFDLLSENILDIINNTASSKVLGTRGKLYQLKDMTTEIQEEINTQYQKRIRSFINENNS